MLELNKVYCMDCIECMKKLEDNSIDAIITDPPYGLEFMGKDWDKFKQGKNIAGGTTGENTPFGRKRALPSFYQLSKNKKNTITNPQGSFEHKKGFKQMVRYATDKPTLLAFQEFSFSWAKECLRVLKHGGYLLAFGGTRTYHRMVCGIEDAGFEIRDTIMWVYGSGFPKSLDISKAIDKMKGRGSIKKGFRRMMPDMRGDNYAQGKREYGRDKVPTYYTEPDTKEAKQWDGWGTALKPACELVVVARKPLSEKTVALNVLRWGTGGINVDACRIGFISEIDKKESKGKNQHSKYPKSVMRNPASNGIYRKDKRPAVDYVAQGRFPANLILDEEAGKILDKQSGERKAGYFLNKGENSEFFGLGKADNTGKFSGKLSDIGGASRFFYCAKASKSERNFGCENLPGVDGGHYRQDAWSRKHMGNTPDEKREPVKNNHPTVKPIKLMEYLIKLVTRENAVVLDPFVGSGTTALACINLSRRFIGIEQSEEYCDIANARLKPYLVQTK